MASCRQSVAGGHFCVEGVDSVWDCQWERGGGWELHEKVIEVEGEKWQSTSPQTRPDSPLDQLLRNQILPE